MYYNAVDSSVALTFIDGDLVTIADTSDLNLAKHLSRIIRITIFSEFIFCHTSFLKNPAFFLSESIMFLHYI